MKALDTSAWIEWLIASEIGEAVLAEVPGLTPLLVPTIVQYELAKWLTRERGEDECASIMAFIAATCTVASLDSEIALDAADIGAMHRLATANAIIYATALRNRIPLITCDAHFKGLPGVVFIPKRPPVP